MNRILAILPIVAALVVPAAFAQTGAQGPEGLESLVPPLPAPETGTEPPAAPDALPDPGAGPLVPERSVPPPIPLPPPRSDEFTPPPADLDAPPGVDVPRIPETPSPAPPVVPGPADVPPSATDDAFDEALADFQRERLALQRVQREAQFAREQLRQAADSEKIRQLDELRNLLTQLIAGDKINLRVGTTPRGRPGLVDEPQLGSEPPEDQPLATPVDPLAAARLEFRAGKYQAAQRHYEQALTQGNYSPQTQLMIEYMIANCLRHQGNIPAAKGKYQKIIDSGRDPRLAEHARRQLESLKTREELEKSLEQLKEFRRELEQQDPEPSPAPAPRLTPPGPPRGGTPGPVTP
ncbi:MAG: tetratricopeptide repeat protein [Planctomycetes bacterium]|nr:tetratricopeptide repeat protein [Planctomycetota bacterium]